MEPAVKARSGTHLRPAHTRFWGGQDQGDQPKNYRN